MCRQTGKLRLFTSLANSRINQVGDLILEIEFPNGLTPFIENILNDSSNKKDLTDLLYQETGKQWHIKLKDGKNSKPVDNEPKENISTDNSLGIDINIIE